MIVLGLTSSNNSIIILVYEENVFFLGHRRFCCCSAVTGRWHKVAAHWPAGFNPLTVTHPWFWPTDVPVTPQFSETARHPEWTGTSDGDSLPSMFPFILQNLQTPLSGITLHFHLMFPSFTNSHEGALHHLLQANKLYFPPPAAFSVST